eukprot:CFRG2681T1
MPVENTDEGVETVTQQLSETKVGEIQFRAPKIQDNVESWGPVDLPEMHGIPFQPYSKGDPLGKVADWTGNAYHDRRYREKYQQRYGAGGTAFSYQHEVDESSFRLVDRNPAQKPRFTGRRFRQRRRESLHRTGAGGLQRLGNKSMRGGGARGGRGGRGGFGRWGNRREQRTRDSSVAVQAGWEVQDEIEFSRLTKLAFSVPEPEDLMTCGTLERYDKSYDRVTTRNPKPLNQFQKVFHNVTTTDDPIFRDLAQSTNAKVFATDAIIATLMACPRSVYSWDIVVQRVGDKLFLDKRDNSQFDFLTVNETAQEPPNDEAENKNNVPANLAIEATYINQNFSQQVLKNGDTVDFEEPNPFAEDDENVCSVGYRYRKWDLGSDIELIARCEVDAFQKSPKGEESYLLVKALNEYDPKSVGLDWRQKLDSQKGAVLAMELKNNSMKLAKWTACALLSGCEQLKLGYVSRENPKDSSKHEILGMQSYKPQELAEQISLNMHNGWGIVRSIVDICLAKPEGKYLILKDPNKAVIRFYEVPMNAFEDDDESGDDGAPSENPFALAE